MASLTIRTVHTKLSLPLSQQDFERTIETLGSYVTIKPNNLGSSLVALTLIQAKTALGLDEQEANDLKDAGQKASSFSQQKVMDLSGDLNEQARQSAAKKATIWKAAEAYYFEQAVQLPLADLAAATGMTDQVDALQLGNAPELTLRNLIPHDFQPIQLLQPMRTVKALMAGN